MALTQVQRTIWNAALLEAFNDAAVIANRVNRDYEGTVHQGNAVKILSLSDVQVRSYVQGTAVSADRLTDAQQTLTIDQARYASILVEDLDRAFSNSNWVDVASRNMGTQLNYSVEDYVAAGIASGAGTNLTVGTAATSEADSLIAGAVALDKANAPRSGRWAVVGPDFHGALVQDDRFVRAESYGSNGPVMNGLVGRAFGFDIFVSNRLPVASGVEKQLLGTKDGYTLAVAVQESESLRSDSAFADNLRSLLAFGGLAVRPSCLVAAAYTLPTEAA